MSQDLQLAVYWYRKAAEGGSDRIQYKLALFYEKGRGVPKDMAQAIYWYRKAAEQGYGLAQNKLKFLGETW